MAIVKVRVIKCDKAHLDAAVKYTTRTDKTTNTKAPKIDDIQSQLARLHVAEQYVLDGRKVTLADAKFVTPINLLQAEFASQTFMTTKRQWNKTGGRLAYQIIQSFSPDDPVSPQLAHEIGCAFVKEVFAGYEAVVSTHIDRAHIHNHIILNSVSLETGRMIHLKSGDLECKLRAVSDRLCAEHNLSVIDNDRDKRRAKERENAGQSGERHFTEGSFKETINRDIRVAATKAKTFTDIVVLLEELGYQADLSGFHPKIKPPGGKRYFRLDTFYTAEELANLCNTRKRETHSATLHCKSDDNLRQFAQPLDPLAACYLQMCQVLGQQEAQRPQFVPLSEFKDVAQWETDMQFLSEHNISSAATMTSVWKQLQSEHDELNRERYRLNGQKKKMQPIFDAQATVQRLEGATKLTKGEQQALDRAKATLAQAALTPDQAHEKRAQLESRIYEVAQKRKDTIAELKIATRIMQSEPKFAPVLAEYEAQRQANKEHWKEKRAKRQERSQEHSQPQKMQETQKTQVPEENARKEEERRGRRARER